MAVDKLVDSTQLDADLTSVANAIRTKGGTSASLAFPSGFISAVNAISSGVTYAPMSHSVTFKNAKSSTITPIRLQYSSNTPPFSMGRSNITAGNTLTWTPVTDGTHFWFQCANLSTIKYNGATASYTKNGNDFRVDIPSGFDGTIQFELS